MPRRRRSTEELKATLEHLNYEVWMLKRTAEILNANKPNLADETSRVIHNALLESSMIHARSLIDSLYEENPSSSDVVADDFFDVPSDDYHSVRDPMTDLLKTVPHRVGKEIAHLTYDRLGKAPEQWTWPAMQIAVDIDVRLADFRWMLPGRFAKAMSEFTSTAEVPGSVTEVGSKGRNGGD
jgi:hypothetical protein